MTQEYEANQPKEAECFECGFAGYQIWKLVNEENGSTIYFCGNIFCMKTYADMLITNYNNQMRKLEEEKEERRKERIKWITKSLKNDTKR